MNIHVSFVDDHPGYRTHLRKLLEMEGSFVIHREFENGARLLEDIDDVADDIILMDLKMPEMDGYEASKALLAHRPNIKIIILTLFDEAVYILALNKIGVKGFLPKSVEGEMLFHALKCVSRGGYCCSDSAARVLQRNIISFEEQIILTDFEKLILTLISEGKSSTEIASLIHKSARTVEDYRQRLYQKFDVSNKEQLITKYVQLKIASPHGV